MCVGGGGGGAAVGTTNASGTVVPTRGLGSMSHT